MSKLSSKIGNWYWTEGTHVLGCLKLEPTRFCYKAFYDERDLRENLNVEENFAFDATSQNGIWNGTMCEIVLNGEIILSNVVASMPLLFL